MKKIPKMTYPCPTTEEVELHPGNHLCQASATDSMIPGTLPEGDLFIEDFVSII